MIRSTTAIVALCCATPAFAGLANSASYGWEDGVGTVLGGYSSGSGVLNYENTDANPFSGSRSLKIDENPTGGTPQAFIGFVTGLTDGDLIFGNFMVFDDSEGASPSVRIWASYATSDDITNYSGSAGGNSTYSDGTGWSELSHEWTFDSGGGERDALVIQVRMYSDAGSTPIYIDDLNVSTTNESAVINFAPAPGAIALLGLAGVAARRRRG